MLRPWREKRVGSPLSSYADQKFIAAQSLDEVDIVSVTDDQVNLDSAANVAAPAGDSTDTLLLCTICSRSFRSKRGLSVHQRAMHPQEYHMQSARDLKSKVKIKSRWSQNEIETMAYEEARLLNNNPNAKVNMELLQLFPNRTLESIKGKRRNAEYRNKVRSFMSLISEQNVADDADDTEISLECDTLEPIVEEIGEVLVEDSLTCDDTVLYYLDERGTMHTPSNEIVQYLNDMNNLNFCAPPTCEELKLLDMALVKMNSDQDMAKSLCNSFLSTKMSLELDFTSKPFRSYPLRDMSRRKRKRLDYAKLQSLYKKNRRSAYKNLMSGVSFADDLECDVVFPFWTALMSQPDYTFFGSYEIEDENVIISDFVQIQEVTDAKLEFNSAPGPDKLTVSGLCRFSARQRAKLYTLWLHLGWVPETILKSKTIFIPKCQNTSIPADMRPITISSTLLRQFHKILSARLSSKVPVSSLQFGFQKLDGIAAAIKNLNEMFGSVHEMNPFCLASLDVAKAFDSISHRAILGVLRKKNVDERFLKYMEFIYRHSSTRLYFRGTYSNTIYPTRGVRQGDPLSAYLFILVLDHILHQLPVRLGYKNNNKSIPYLAYADDLLICANSPTDLQMLLDVLALNMPKIGLDINFRKCFTLTWLVDHKLKKTIFDREAIYKYNNRNLRSLDICDEFMYLGIAFKPSGATKCPAGDFVEKLSTLRKSLLKPQQKLFLLRTMLIPSYYHCLALSRVHVGYLNRLDLRVRAFVRGVLHLPHDFPNAAFYASAKDGGLGLPCLRWSIPLMARARLGDPWGRLTRMLQWDHKEIKNKNMLLRLFKNKLYTMVDGKGLRQSALVPATNYWVSDGTRLLSGRDFVSSIHLRYNCMPCKSRLNRGRSTDNRCSRGCGQAETLNHIIQRCYSTHAVRIKRHNSLVNYVTKSLSQRGFTVLNEEVHRVDNTNFKPDITAYSTNLTIVIDIQIINDQFPLSTAHRNKKNKYELPLRDHLRNLRPGGVFFTTLTANWRGAIAKDSFDDLTSLRLLSKKDFKILASRAIIGGIVACRRYQRMTSHPA